jgi:NAD(P)H-dependent flavin oxidoreductase YrpB (nitropropane dioxygenase family)
MQTDFCKQLGIEAPIFAFTHCRDVVVAVSKAGGIGVLGAVGFSPAKLKEELDWRSHLWCRYSHPTEVRGYGLDQPGRTG